MAAAVAEEDVQDDSDVDEVLDKRQAIQQLLDANGIKEEDARNPERVTHIEMVLDDYCCMDALRYFTNLRSVCLIQQAITKLEGLDNCAVLERLLLNENRITKLEGLQGCTKLKCLHLCSNAIQEIGDGLSGLVQLEVLWVAENQLSNLLGLGEAPNLKELNASRNMLTSVIQAFDQNMKLTSINLSDNRICSFRDVLDLARLPGLRDLAFEDPDWGENPICFLCNYQTYVLFHLPSLRVHDRMRITDEEHQAAEISFSKKRLYYNMKIKLLKRLASDGLRWAKTVDDERTTAQTQELENVARTLKQIDAAALESVENRASAQPQRQASSSTQDRAAIEKQLQELQGELADAAALHNSLNQVVQAEKAALIQSLELELQTGGNVRMEEGTEKDRWVQSVEDVVKTRFFANDLAKFGISDIRIHKVLRVHNRSLRTRLEELLDRTEAQAETQLHQLEYLFYVPRPEHSEDDIRAVIAEGPGCELKMQSPIDVAGTVVLTNSVSIVEASRLERMCSTDVGQAIARSSQQAGRRLNTTGGNTKSAAPAGVNSQPVVCSGTLLLCSTHLGEQRAHSPPTFAAGEAGSAGARALWSSEILLGSQTMPTASESVMHPALFRTRDDDPKQKVWCVSQPELVLPEFLVEFDYVYGTESMQSQMPTRLAEYGPFGGVFRDFAFHSKPSAPEQKDEEVESSVAPSRIPAVPQIERMDSASLSALRSELVGVSDVAMFSSLQVLNLTDRGIRRMEGAALLEMTQLRFLLLSFNYLDSTSNLPRLPSIEHIDLSFNLIEKVDTLSGLTGLRELDLSWNSLLSLDVLHNLARDVSQLASLHLVGNPITKGPSGAHCRVRALARLKCLKALDGREVTPREVLEAQQSDVQETELAESMLMERAYASASSQGLEERQASCRSAAPPSMDWDSKRNRISDLLGSSVGYGDPSRCITRNNWKSFAESLDLRKLGLTDVKELHGFNQLRRLLVSSNELSSLKNLSGLASLEELSVEENVLQSLDGVPSPMKLRRLDAGSNQVAEVLALQKLTRLSQLSLEDNYIDSLDTFATLHSLMELYLSNNLIEELRSVLMLKPLTKLVVLDLSGNGLCSVQDYRLYTIFHLRKLKVLDGVTVAQAEQASADDKFSGKLTMELLEDKLGPVPACYNLRSVDLSGMNLRDLGNLLHDDIFPSLRELMLDGNPFSDLRTVGPLSKLLVFRMNKSKIDLEKMVAEDDQMGGVGSMPHLQVLEIGDSGIMDISHFASFQLNSLRILHLPNNDIVKLEGLSHLEQLRELVIDHNKVKQFDEGSFQGLRCLRELRAEDNCLRSLANLAPLPRLRALYLSQNRVAEVSELEKLASLRHVILIHLQQNPVARKPLYRANILQAASSVRVIDGKEVTEDEREKCEQLLQATDSSKQMGMYVFVEQQPASYNQAASSGHPGAVAQDNSYRPMVQPGFQDKGLDNGVLKRQGADLLRGGAALAQQQQPQAAPGHIMMMGQGFSEGDDRRGDATSSISGAMAARRVAPAVNTVSTMARHAAAGNASHGASGPDGGGGESAGGGTSKKPFSSRAPVPRH